MCNERKGRMSLTQPINIQYESVMVVCMCIKRIILCANVNFVVKPTIGLTSNLEGAVATLSTTLGRVAFTTRLSLQMK